MSNSVAELEEVSIRKQWPNEEADFTPWLANNISRLSSVLDIDLEVQDTEANVGSYYADIYATNIAGDTDVIIENQYGNSDHKHFGQSLVYGGGFDADIVVWVAEDFNDAHLEAIEWFNKRTDENTGFFAAEVSLVRIQDSPVAPRFNIVEKPSSWGVFTEDLTETEREHRRFWQMFEKRLEERCLSKYAENRTITSASYVTQNFGKAYIRPAATTHDDIYCMVRIEDESGTFANLDQSEVTEALVSAHSNLQDTPVLTSEVRNVEWESNSEGLYDKITIHYSDDIDRSDKSEWKEYHDWIIDVTQIFDEILESEF